MSTVRHSVSFDIRQSVKPLFPSFSAEVEKLWVPGWYYENIMGETDFHEEFIFVTNSHEHAASDAIWAVKRY